MSTRHESTDVPAWPVYDLTVHDDGRVLASGPLVPTSGHATRASAIDVVAGAAARLGRAVRATATEPSGVAWQLIVSPGGEVSEDPAGAPRTTVPRKRQTKRSARTQAVAAQAVVSDAPVSRSRSRKDTEAYEESLDEVRAHLEAGRADQARELAAQLDTRATGVFGVSHPDTLRIREVRAGATAMAGDTAGGIQLYRDVAERWHYRGDAEQAEAVAGRAEQLWMRITDVGEALSAGVALIRLRSQIPGEAGAALTAVLRHRDRLLTAHDTHGPREEDHTVADSPAPRSRRPAPTWERPAVGARKAG
ncbi:hypothetical protein ACIREO_19510 [Streptomyces sp. NPDC102441]|uniref:hypothetical protein n=1 Tax=Streptomyces sp. NPDC102441 TaxID=3366176 RepID=UPI00382C46DF